MAIACSLALVGLAAMLSTRPARADNRTGVVLVSVQVVESCRVNTAMTEGGVGLHMRCSSTARPALGWSGGVAALSASGVTSVPETRIISTPAGKLVSIQF